MKKLLAYFLITFCFTFCLAAQANAAKVYLKDGKTIEGKIIEQNERRVRLDVDGITLSYYLEEVQRIENEKQEVIFPEKEAELFKPFSESQSKSQPKTSADQGYKKAESNLKLAVMNKRELILKYMEVTGVTGNMRKTFAQIVNNAPKEKQRKIKNALKMEGILEQLVPIYSQYFTEEDLKNLIQFYQSQAGQKLLKTAPLILKESMEKSLKYLQGRIE